MSTQVVILAGGLATRMLPATERVPKLLLEVRGRPFFDWLATRLFESGVDDIVLCVGHLANEIRQYLSQRPDIARHTRCVDERDTRLGTGGAIALADREGLLDDQFLVTYGDSYLTFDYALPLTMLAARNDLDGVMAVYENDVPHEPSNSLVEGDLVTRYEKGTRDPRLRWIDYGATAIRREVIRRGAQQLGPVFGFDAIQQSLATQARLGACVVHERFHEIGSPRGRDELEAFLTYHSA
ncbi:MAG: NTP transferase domain-containing protein [Polyangiaceae bacterium]